MPGSTTQQRALTWLGFAVAYLATFFLSSALATPLVWFHPAESRFSIGARPPGIVIDFFGRVLLSLLGGGVGAGVLALCARRLGDERGARWVRVLGIWTVALLAFTAGLYVYGLVGRDVGR